MPREAIPALIGKKGANLSKIREESGAHIDVPNAGEGRAVRGTRENIIPVWSPPVTAAISPGLHTFRSYRRVYDMPDASSYPHVSLHEQQQKTVSVRIRATPNAPNGLSSEEQVGKAKAAIIAHLAEWTKNNALQEVRHAG